MINAGRPNQARSEFGWWPLARLHRLACAGTRVDSTDEGMGVRIDLSGIWPLGRNVDPTCLWKRELFETCARS